MGGYPDSSDEDRKRKKKRKKRSLSRSRETSVESSISSRKSGKHKSKKKKRQRVKSRSRSVEAKQRRRSRSHSRDRGYRRSRSTSRSRIFKRSRSRSYERRRSRSRSRSYERDRRPRRSRSRSFSRRRSHSRDRRSRSRSFDRRRRRSRSGSYDNEHKKDKDDPCASVPGFADMTPSDQARVRMQLALKAADSSSEKPTTIRVRHRIASTAADEKLKEQGVLLNPKSAMSAGEQKRFNKALEKIEKESFVPAAFTSSADKPKPKEDDGFGRSNHERNHDSAIFGSGKLDMKLDPSERTNVVYTGATSLAHPNLNKTAEEKMGRWIEKLTAMRKRRMEGELLS